MYTCHSHLEMCKELCLFHPFNPKCSVPYTTYDKIINKYWLAYLNVLWGVF